MKSIFQVQESCRVTYRRVKNDATIIRRNVNAVLYNSGHELVSSGTPYSLEQTSTSRV
jgi:hypothetical protein